MLMIRLVIAAILVGLSPAAVTAQDNEIVVRGSAARVEIERILNADNLNTVSLSARDVADTIVGINRGRAPADFWDAYQAHVRAWQRLADAEDRARRLLDNGTSFAEVAAQVVEAERLIESTFDEVERIALGYGARMPIPPVEIVPTA